MALDLLGKKHITSLNDGSLNAVLLTTWSAVCYEDVLRVYKPHHFTKTETLYYNVASGGYQLPTDYVILTDVLVDRYTIQDDILKVDNGTGGDTIDLTYVSNSDKLLQTAPKSFGLALSCYIASKIALPLTKDSKLAQKLEQDAMKAWARYNFSNNSDRRPRKFAEGLNNMSTWTIR